MCGPRLPILRVHVRKDSAQGDGDSFVRRRPRKMPPLASVDSCPGLGSCRKGTRAIPFGVIGAKDRKSTKKVPSQLAPEEESRAEASR